MQRIIIFSFILAMSHCKDTYDNTAAAAQLQVPPFTETGANTFGCDVNGQPWANFGAWWDQTELGYGILEPNKVIAMYTIDSGKQAVSITGKLSISKNGTPVRQETMTLIIPTNIPDVIDVGLGIHQLTGRDGLFNYNKAIPYYGVYSSLTRSPFTVTVLNDNPNYSQDQEIISGKFSGFVYNSNQSDSLKITGGVFDVLINF